MNVWGIASPASDSWGPVPQLREPGYKVALFSPARKTPQNKQCQHPSNQSFRKLRTILLCIIRAVRKRPVNKPVRTCDLETGTESLNNLRTNHYLRCAEVTRGCVPHWGFISLHLGVLPSLTRHNIATCHPHNGDWQMAASDTETSGRTNWFGTSSRVRRRTAVLSVPETSCFVDLLKSATSKFPATLEMILQNTRPPVSHTLIKLPTTPQSTPL
jgi:hypothetical protein